MFALSPMFDTVNGFAVTASVNGVSVSVIPDDETVEALGGDVLTNEPGVLLPTTAAATAAAGQACVMSAGNLPAVYAHLAGTYTVRRVEKVPPDAALTRLVLAKVSA
jgi:hypothetical protein